MIRPVNTIIPRSISKVKCLKAVLSKNTFILKRPFLELVNTIRRKVRILPTGQ
jgi:hypothetical protein